MLFCEKLVEMHMMNVMDIPNNRGGGAQKQKLQKRLIEFECTNWRRRVMISAVMLLSSNISMMIA